MPTKAIKLNFWQKMKELQLKMLLQEQQETSSNGQHMYENESPLSWLLLQQGIAYWVDASSNAQIYLIGNIFLWFLSLAALGTMSIGYAIGLLRQRRKFNDISHRTWAKYSTAMAVLVGGYVAHLAPFFLVEQQLFLHHYLPALCFKLLALAACYELIADAIYDTIARPSWRRNWTLLHTSAGVVSLAFIAKCFVHLLPLSYGSGQLSAADIEQLKYRHDWHLIVHKI